jgi:hypothetical protein
VWRSSRNFYAQPRSCTRCSFSNHRNSTSDNGFEDFEDLEESERFAFACLLESQRIPDAYEDRHDVLQDNSDADSVVSAINSIFSVFSTSSMSSVGTIPGAEERLQALFTTVALRTSYAQICKEVGTKKNWKTSFNTC